MKKDQIKPNELPFMNDQSHIYNKLIDNGIHQVNLGWSTFVFEIHGDLYSDNKKVDGVTEFDSKKIKFEMSLDDLTARETIIHELFHCMLESVGLDEYNFDSSMFSTSNEAMVVALTRQQLVLHNLNPGLYSLIFEDAQTAPKRKRNSGS